MSAGYTIFWDENMPFHLLSDEKLLDALHDAQLVWDTMWAEGTPNLTDQNEQGGVLRALRQEAARRGLE